MTPHVCPWWGGYVIDNRFRRWLHDPEVILAPFLQSGMTVLDFGCGMGFSSIPIAHLIGDEGRVIAIDLQQKMLDVLAERAARSGVADRIRTHRCETDSIGTCEPVDFALAFYSAHEVPEVRRLLDEIHTCLRPGCKFLIVEPLGHVRKGLFEEMVSMGRDTGLVVEHRPRIRLSHSVLLTKPA